MLRCMDAMCCMNITIFRCSLVVVRNHQSSVLVHSSLTLVIAMKISISSELGWYRYPLFWNVGVCLLVLLISLLFSPYRPRTWYRWWIWRSHQPFPIASGLSLELCLKRACDVYSQPLSLEFFCVQFWPF